MFYFINLILSLLVFYFIYLANPSKRSFSMASFVVILMWTVFLGSQLNVGTDYENYLIVFRNKYALEYYRDIKSEIGFYYFVSFFNNLGLSGQDLFYVFYFFTSLLFFKFTSLITYKYVGILIFLYITVSTLFHYQLNGLRQCSIVFLISWGVLEYYRKKYLIFAVTFLIAFLFHKSIILILPVVVLLRYLKFSWNKMTFLVLLSSLVSLIPLEELINALFGYVIQFGILQDYNRYTEDSEYIKDISILNKITKLVYLPFYLYTIYIFKNNLNKFQLSAFELDILKLGFFSYCVRNFFLVSSITNRLGLFFTLLSVIPLYFLIRDLYQRKDYLRFNIVIFIFLLFYFLKVVLFPEEVYGYDSVLFY